MTTIDPTKRMIEFIDSAEADSYAIKASLCYAPAMVGNDRQLTADSVRDKLTELYQLFGKLDDHQPIATDVPDLDDVDWLQIADHLIIPTPWDR